MTPWMVPGCTTRSTALFAWTRPKRLSILRSSMAAGNAPSRDWTWPPGPHAARRTTHRFNCYGAGRSRSIAEPSDPARSDRSLARPPRVRRRSFVVRAPDWGFAAVRSAGGAVVVRHVVVNLVLAADDVGLDSLDGGFHVVRDEGLVVLVHG